MRAPFVYDPNADIEERCQIYLGRHEETKLYTCGILNWFRNRLYFAKPSEEKVNEYLREYIAHYQPWTSDLHRADCWDGYWIDMFQRFLPEIEWRKAVLRTVPID